MAKRERFTVGPSNSGEGWSVKRQGASRASSVHDTKAEAVDRARGQAKAEPLSQVVVKGKDGKIQTEWTYGKDPFPPRG